MNVLGFRWSTTLPRAFFGPGAIPVLACVVALKQDGQPFFLKHEKHGDS